MKENMFLFHIHCGAKRVSFKEASHFYLLSTLWGLLSLAYTVRTKHIPSNNPVIIFLSYTLLVHFSSALFWQFLSFTQWGLSRYSLQAYRFFFFIYSMGIFLSPLHCGGKGCFFFKEIIHVSLSSTLWGHFSHIYTVGSKDIFLKTSVMLLSQIHCADTSVLYIQ